MSEVGQPGPMGEIEEESALRCEGLTKAFQGVHAVNGAAFEVPKGQITALIGPNGAGKTTVVNILSGSMTCDRGRVHRCDRGDELAQPSHCPTRSHAHLPALPGARPADSAREPSRRSAASSRRVAIQ